MSDMERLGDIMERVRREVERCDTFQGFQICQSIEESKTMLLHDIKEEYPCKIVNAYSTISQKTCDKDKVMLSYLKTYCDSIVLFDDKKIKDICTNQKMNIESEACHLIARVIADVSSIFRFPSQVWVLYFSSCQTSCLQQNFDLQQLLDHTVPDKSCPFLSPSLAPLISCRRGIKSRPQHKIHDLLNQLQWSDHCLSSVSFPTFGRKKDDVIFSIFRGDIKPEDIPAIKDTRVKESVSFVKMPPICAPMSAVMLRNSSDVCGYLGDLGQCDLEVNLDVIETNKSSDVDRNLTRHK